MEKERILIVDDNEINRFIIRSMLEDKYELIEASNGLEAIEVINGYHGDIDLILLDLIMPELDGLGVLKEMNEKNWIENIPVIVISAENSTSYVRKAYEMGADDFINRPFDPETVSRRIRKTLLLHSQKKNLIDALTEEFSKREKNNDLMIKILSHIVEQRNGESGLHVIHINLITSILLKQLMKHTDKYGIKEEDIPVICNASSLHDIGKMNIPEIILNKPGKLTPGEFEIIKQHSMLGYEIMCKVDEGYDEPLIRYAKNITRYHHEKWDGKGYPDRLVGDNIPIEAQVVSIADCYDALTQERCYKPAYSHDQAMNMLLNGECGQFNPLLMECLKEVEPELRTIRDVDQGDYIHHTNEDILTSKTINGLNSTKGTDISRNILLLRSEEKRHEVYREFSNEGWFELYTQPYVLRFNKVAQKLLNLPELIKDPFHNEQFMKVCGMEFKHSFGDEFDKSNDEESFDVQVVLADKHYYRMQGKYFISSSNKEGFERYISGAIGKIESLR